MKVLPASAIVAWLSTLAPVVLGNAVREYPLEKKVHGADVVVIGRAVSTRSEPSGGLKLEYARVHVDRALKGTPPNEIDVLTKGSIAELSPDCCTTGGVYLFFLKTIKDDKYESVNGKFGIYLIPTQAK
ncbi:MAG TPA: hypothetical protein VK762_16920 [Polyangiaceae bacterium]|jgi:hypothetical protein|nr:hypothetical protein [Polyangiaceae bacterium]